MLLNNLKDTTAQDGFTVSEYGKSASLNFLLRYFYEKCET